MGFNNGGVDAFVANVQASRFYQNREGVIGLNIGKNADTPIERAVDDYLLCLEKVYPYASYVTVNISSPNTKNLRQLQGALGTGRPAVATESGAADDWQTGTSATCRWR